jgi:hypothetical protein
MVRTLPAANTAAWGEADTTATTVTGLELYAFCHWLNGKLIKANCGRNVEFGTQLSGS